MLTNRETWGGSSIVLGFLYIDTLSGDEEEDDDNENILPSRVVWHISNPVFEVKAFYILNFCVCSVAFVCL